MKVKLAEAIELRKNNRAEDALNVLKALLEKYPNNADIFYQLAWTCDSMGHEVEAAAYYENAFSNGLIEDREGAILGLGSTYRCIGEYRKSLETFNRGIREFPENRSLKVFRALTLYNLGEHEDSTRELLSQLLETAGDNSIKSYDRALRFYSDKLNEIWT